MAGVDPKDVDVAQLYDPLHAAAYRLPKSKRS
jgi:hypothetical protein